MNLLFKHIWNNYKNFILISFLLISFLNFLLIHTLSKQWTISVSADTKLPLISTLNVCPLNDSNCNSIFFEKKVNDIMQNYFYGNKFFYKNKNFVFFSNTKKLDLNNLINLEKDINLIYHEESEKFINFTETLNHDLKLSDNNLNKLFYSHYIKSISNFNFFKISEDFIYTRSHNIFLLSIVLIFISISLPFLIVYFFLNSIKKK